MKQLLLIIILSLLSVASVHADEADTAVESRIKAAIDSGNLSGVANICEPYRTKEPSVYYRGQIIPDKFEMCMVALAYQFESMKKSSSSHMQCCKICSKGKACGNSCINRSYQCNQPSGCACDG